MSSSGPLPLPAATWGHGLSSRSASTMFDAVCAELAAHGVDLLNGPVNRPWGVRTASFTDPGGHVWEIAQELSRADGS